VTVNAGATLGGSGTVGRVTVHSGGMQLPRENSSSPAMLSTGNLGLNSGSTFSAGGTRFGAREAVLVSLEAASPAKILAITFIVPYHAGTNNLCRRARFTSISSRARDISRLRRFLPFPHQFREPFGP
jgi:hypothetical protein